MANKKYELLENDTKMFLGLKLYRIRALFAVGLCVDAGDLGGYIESEKNLSAEGACWVRDSAIVFGSATVCGYADVKKSLDIQCYQGVGSENGTLTAYRTNEGIELVRGCFQGDLAKFRDAVHQKHGSSKIGKHYLGICNLIALWFDMPEAIEP